MQKTQAMSLDDFKKFVLLPENEDRLFELIDGEVIEVMPGRVSNSQIHDIITASVRPFCKMHKIPCCTSSADGAYQVGSKVVAPDFAYRRIPPTGDYPEPEPPLWAVEIISPTDEVGNIRKKRNIYREAGILLWEIYPEDFLVHVYAPNQSLTLARMGEVISLGDVIPGFSIAVADLFE